MKTKFTRRIFLTTTALATAASPTAPLWPRKIASAESFTTTLTGRRIATGPFEPAWESLVAANQGEL